MKFPPINNPFLKTYLEYVDDTESPRIFHIWSALSALSACLGRRCYVDYGVQHLFPNQFVLLVGPPAVKKSTAIKLATSLVKEATGVRFAPDDTGGARQGLIKHMENRRNEDDLADEEVEAALHALEFSDARNLGNITVNLNNELDRHCLYIAASEFNTFIGIREITVLSFLGKMWDGEDYEYSLKDSDHILTNPLLNLLGGTTPTNIADSMPPSATGGGFMSRLIFVHADAKHKSVPWPSALDNNLAVKIKQTFSWAHFQANGEFEVSPEARKLLIDLYDVELRLNDTRFIYYCDRRNVHLIKLCTAFAAGRQSQLIEREDVEDAQALLSFTERSMPEALGEFGLNPLSASKQKLLEYIRHCNVAVPENNLWVMMAKDMRKIDFLNTMQDLVASRKVTELSSPKAGRVFMFNRQRHDEVLELENELIDDMEELG